MKKSTYIKTAQQAANQKLWDSLMEKYMLLKKKNKTLAYLWFPVACIIFGVVSVVSFIHRLTMYFKDIRFTPHYMQTFIEHNNMNLEQANEYLNTKLSEYKKSLSYGNFSPKERDSIDTTFELLFKKYKLPESDEKHNEIISNFSTLQQSIEITGQDILTVEKDINYLSVQTKQHNSKLSNDLNDIKQDTFSISQYTNKKLSEEKEIEERKIKKTQREASKYNREKGRNLDTFESALSDKQIAILVKYCNDIPVFNIDITHEEMKAILYCTHSKPLQTTVNKYVALLFERLCDEKLICKTWKSVAMHHKCFISANGKDLTAKDLSSANATSGIIKPKLYDLIEDCIDKIKEV